MNHVAIEWLGIGTGTKFQHIPYRGGAPAGAAVAAGDVPLGTLAISSALPHVKAGRMRVLALTTAKSSSFNPEWKTLQQLGVPEVDASNWVGMFAPKGTPQPIVDKLNTAFRESMKPAETQALLAKLGADIKIGSPDDFKKMLGHELKLWTDVAKAANISVD
jgi:tripartite-type tricarboxylate transporter receptor subunit TctC